MFEEGRSGPDRFFLNALRIVSGFLFWQHGAQKLFGMLGGTQVELVSLMGLAGIIEFFGGLLIAVGLFTRPVAFVTAGEMAVAYFLVHVGQQAETTAGYFFPIMNGGERAALFCFVFLYLAARGGGTFSLDAWMRSRRESRVAGG